MLFLAAFLQSNHLAAGLQDVLLGRVTEIGNAAELNEHLDAVFNET